MVHGLETMARLNAEASKPPGSDADLITSLQRELAEAREACRQAVDAMRDYPAYPEDADADRLAAARRRCEMILSPAANPPIKDSLTTAEPAQAPASSADHFCPYHGKAWCHCKPAPAPSDVKGEEPGLGDLLTAKLRTTSFEPQADGSLKRSVRSETLGEFADRVVPDSKSPSLTPLTDPSVLGVLVAVPRDGSVVYVDTMWNGVPCRVRPASEFVVAARGEPGLKKLPDKVHVWEETGEVRPPKKGESFLEDDGIHIAHFDFENSRERILRKLDPALYAIPDGERIKELEAELADWPDAFAHAKRLKQESDTAHADAERLRKAIEEVLDRAVVAPKGREILRAALSPSPAAASGETTKQHHMAREGEPEYCVITRNRSGQDSGSIDYRIAVSRIDDLPDGEKAELAKTARLAAEKIADYCKPTSAPAAESEGGEAPTLKELARTLSPLVSRDIEAVISEHAALSARLAEHEKEPTWKQLYAKLEGAIAACHVKHCGDGPVSDTAQEEFERIAARLAACEERCRELEAGIRAQLGPLDQDQQTEVIARSLRSLRSSPDRPRVDHERPGP